MKKIFNTILFDIFYLLIGTYIALMILENLKPGLVSNYLDLNKILYLLAPLGILCVLVNNKKVDDKKINNEINGEINNKINNKQKYD
jgi:hypothetical protein